MQEVLEPHAGSPRNQPRLRLVTAGPEASLCVEHPDRMSVVHLDDETLAWLAPRIEQLAKSRLKAQAAP